MRISDWSSDVCSSDLEIARVFVLRIDGRERIERGALEERDLDIAREAMEAQEPALALDPVEGRVPSDRLQRIGNGPRAQRVEAAPGIAFPARPRGGNVLPGGVPAALGLLRSTTHQ